MGWAGRRTAPPHTRLLLSHACDLPRSVARAGWLLAGCKGAGGRGAAHENRAQVEHWAGRGGVERGENCSAWSVEPEGRIGGRSRPPIAVEESLASLESLVTPD